MYGRDTKGDLQIRALAHPVDLRARHHLCPERYPFLLQSTAPGSALGRYDILFAYPGESLELDSAGRLTGRASSDAATVLDALDEWWHSEYRPASRADLPFTGGWFLYLGYELASEIEPLLALHTDDLLPKAFAVR